MCQIEISPAIFPGAFSLTFPHGETFTRFPNGTGTRLFWKKNAAQISQLKTTTPGPFCKSFEKRKKRLKGPIPDGAKYHNYEYNLRKKSNAEATFAVAVGGPQVHGRVVSHNGSVFLIHNDGQDKHVWIGEGVFPRIFFAAAVAPPTVAVAVVAVVVATSMEHMY